MIFIMKDIGRILKFEIAQTIRIQWRITYSEILSRIFEEYGRFKEVPYLSDEEYGRFRAVSNLSDEEYSRFKNGLHPYLKDEDIILGLKTLNDSVIRNLYFKSYPEVERKILLGGGSFEDAQDIFQMAVMILTEKVKQGRYNQRSTIYTYLFSIAENIWKNERRKIAKRNKIFVYNKMDYFDKNGGKKVRDGMIDIEIPEKFEKIKKWLKELPENL